MYTAVQYSVKGAHCLMLFTTTQSNTFITQRPTLHYSRQHSSIYQLQLVSHQSHAVLSNPRLDVTHRIKQKVTRHFAVGGDLLQIISVFVQYSNFSQVAPDLDRV